MRFLYDIFFLVFSVFYIPGLLIKGKLHRDFAQKLGRLPGDVKCLKKPVWIHAVSVGEAAVAAELATGIKERHPSRAVVASPPTRTGNDMIKKKGKGVVDAVIYYPFDFGAVVSRVVKKIDPVLYIMVETELWPNLLEELALREVPVILANGRISDNSFRNYNRIKFITRNIFRCITAACVQTDADAEKIKALGADGDRIFVCGNMKFDAVLPYGKKPAFSKEQLGFGEDDEVIVAGSTHFPEEKIMQDAFVELRGIFRDLKLVIAPRHIERKEAIRIYAEKTSLKTAFFSEMISRSNVSAVRPDVVIVDTIGHLKDLYGLGTIVFIGGSMAGKGGQNPIEAALWTKAVVFGPDMSNFREVSRIFLDDGAAVKVNNARELFEALKSLLEDGPKREKIAAGAFRVIKENSGAVRKTLEILDRYISEN